MTTKTVHDYVDIHDECHKQVHVEQTKKQLLLQEAKHCGKCCYEQCACCARHEAMPSLVAR